MTRRRSVRASHRLGGWLVSARVSRVEKHYLLVVLQAALTDETRGTPDNKLDSTQPAAVIAIVCWPPPAGRTRWTVRLVTEQVVKRGMAPQLGRETIRIVLATHDLEPWRETNGVRAEDRSGIRRFSQTRLHRSSAMELPSATASAAVHAPSLSLVARSVVIK